MDGIAQANAYGSLRGFLDSRLRGNDGKRAGDPGPVIPAQAGIQSARSATTGRNAPRPP